MNRCLYIVFLVCTAVLFGSDTPPIRYLAQYDDKNDIQAEAQVDLPHQQMYLSQSIQSNRLLLGRSREMIPSEKMVNTSTNSASRAGIFDKRFNRITGNRIMDSFQNESTISSGCYFVKSRQSEGNEGVFSEVEPVGLHECREVATQTDSLGSYNDQATQTMPEQVTEQDKKLIAAKKDDNKKKEKVCCTC